MEYMFIVNLSGDINVDTTFYKLSQTWTWLISWKARSAIFCDQEEESALHILNIVCLQGSSGTICSLLLVVLLQGELIRTLLSGGEKRVQGSRNLPVKALMVL
jgi:hypothetical protein